MRVRQEAKILKNHRREYVWEHHTTEDGDEFEFPKSRYKPNRVWMAHQRLVKACRRRYQNSARKEWKTNGDSSMFRYYNHMACDDINMLDRACEWWNIPYE